MGISSSGRGWDTGAEGVMAGKGEGRGMVGTRISSNKGSSNSLRGMVVVVGAGMAGVLAEVLRAGVMVGRVEEASGPGGEVDSLLGGRCEGVVLAGVVEGVTVTDVVIDGHGLRVGFFSSCNTTLQPCACGWSNKQK